MSKKTQLKTNIKSNDNPLLQYKDLFEADLKSVDKYILSLAKNRPDLIKQLLEYIISSGGKRLRPVMLILASKLFKNNISGRVNMAACVELLHTATLFHDDVVDGSSIRRGRKTANEIWGNSASVLVGDFLLAGSFGIMSEIGNLEIIRTLSRASSIITSGEINQLMNKQNLSLTEKEYIKVISDKTAELFASCMKVGALLAGADKKTVIALEKFGLYFGISFQIADDALDYIGADKNFGKKSGNDFKEGKLTLPLIHLYQNSDDKFKKHLEDLIDAPPSKRGAKALGEVIKQLHSQNSIGYSMQVAEKYVKMAQKQLSFVKASKAKQALLDILNFAISRKY